MDFKDTEGIKLINNHLTFLNALPECIQHKSSILKLWFIGALASLTVIGINVHPDKTLF